jgi:hypothetical protein
LTAQHRDFHEKFGAWRNIQLALHERGNLPVCAAELTDDHTVPQNYQRCSHIYALRTEAVRQ